MNFPSQFPILNNYTYLNTANSGMLSNDLVAWRNTHDQDFAENGSVFRFENGKIINDLRKNVSQLFGAKFENTYLVQNFSVGFNIILNGFDKNHRFLLLTEDYPSVNYPITSGGFKHFEIGINEHLEENILKAIAEFKPTVFAFSMVQYISGIKIDPQFIKKIKETYPDLLLIGDATQFMGTGEFDFASSGFDAVLGSGYKWLLSGYGNGYAFLSDQIKAEFYKDRKQNNLPTATFLTGRDYLSLCFEPGHLDTLNFGSMNQSLIYLQSLGLDFIEETIQAISQKARTAFHDRGLISDEMLNRKVQSNIISLPLEKEMVAKLESAKILCSARGAGTRFSFHFYNAMDDLDKMLAVLDQK
ncbi:aminotransferase class V-fold PLP-dependent enzyme [Pedobacter frigidisoli]|uniref:Aminotransferase class V-fold PLP-dependent enzyme n=1 Tax=Pedobacter frigidisoli TaxID=2530455 RepID=A0A4R0NZL3_9SPHI|nr:aminotransferase class V-fold PLP-dependent enzyme [Pedobacter frigidisoli]TCD08346.1 aminotransferase class V-fold PLP-dependent enzyme [Pedobacter frigidisoli]